MFKLQSSSHFPDEEAKVQRFSNLLNIVATGEARMRYQKPNYAEMQE